MINNAVLLFLLHEKRLRRMGKRERESVRKKKEQRESERCVYARTSGDGERKKVNCGLLLEENAAITKGH